MNVFWEMIMPLIMVVLKFEPPTFFDMLLLIVPAAYMITWCSANIRL